ncbi:aminoacyl-tRNA hydrolase [candidate division KSB1 bacterium]|nr:aminoacyl-tRNA hydrolase [candidate division KSB1 bacterium]
MINITPTISIHESELQLEFIRSSGPGGQNVNKVATAVQLRFNILHSENLPVELKGRLIQLAGSRLTKDGYILIKAHRHRSQEQNRQDAIDRLVSLIQKASHKPKHRIPTRPTRSSKEKRLEQKQRRSHIKKLRSALIHHD